MVVPWWWYQIVIPWYCWYTKRLPFVQWHLCTPRWRIHGTNMVVQNSFSLVSILTDSSSLCEFLTSYLLKQHDKNVSTTPVWLDCPVTPSWLTATDTHISMPLSPSLFFFPHSTQRKSAKPLHDAKTLEYEQESSFKVRFSETGHDWRSNGSYNGEDDGPILLHHTQMPLEAFGSSE